MEFLLQHTPQLRNAFPFFFKEIRIIKVTELHMGITRGITKPHGGQLKCSVSPALLHVP